ncbi:hypothetical protein GCM10027429_25920 [Marivirga atlantica]|jgi:hypothetical protein|uniref:Uncharacterized protein n=1 Tax=Marivirga atlantica TaxID=1548457 RepID=A0A937A9A9_9BACT|nr:hypothetical protein [Marivirga atlantica]MBL0766192.1 hypothetical protein [Marivirga atlantica]
MDLTKKAKDELEHRVTQLEDFIASKGIGSSYLNRAKKVQRNVNVALVVGGVITLTGLAIWAFSSHEDDED